MVYVVLKMINRTITLNDYHVVWLDKNHKNLSSMVRELIDDNIKEDDGNKLSKMGVD